MPQKIWHLIVPAILLAGACGAAAQSYPIAISQYAHTAWSVRQGFTQDSISSIAQTADGYLWLGTGSGLYRFDGQRSLAWAPVNSKLHSADILTLLAGRDGSLWIGTSEALFRFKSGALDARKEFNNVPVYSLLEAQDGTIWAGGGDGIGQLCAIKGDKGECYAGAKELGRWVSALHQDQAGNLWVAGMGLKGLWHWAPGNPVFVPLQSSEYVAALGEVENSKLLIAATGGIQEIVDGKASAFELPKFNVEVKPRYFLRDREGGLWIGTAGQGLAHISRQHVDTFTTADGLSGDLIKAIFQDREGNVWVATMDGLDRFRNLAISTISTKQGLSSSSVTAVLAARDGSMWFSTHDGLNHWQDGTNTIYLAKGDVSLKNGLGRISAPGDVKVVTDSGLPDSATGSLYEDQDGRIWVSTAGGIGYFANGRFTQIPNLPGRFVSAITGQNNGSIWFSEINLGLVHLIDGILVDRISWDKFNHKDDATSLLFDPRGGLWLGFSEGGLVYFADGKVAETYGAAEHVTGTVNSLTFDRAGNFWAATDDGLVLVKQRHVKALTTRNGLPCNAAQEFAQDSSSVWLYTACGLLRIPQEQMDAWAGGRIQQITFTAFNNADGVRTHTHTSAYSPGIAQSADGRIWFLPFDGVSVVDPSHLYANPLPPPVYVEQVTADQHVYDAGGRVDLPPLIRNLKIDYTALSLADPERVMFRYMLEGYDRGWQDAGNLREAFYNNLPPGSYMFHVIASNNSGVWNSVGASQAFRIAPAYYQTRWFRLLCVVAGVGLIWLIYELRLRSVENRFLERKKAEEALRKVEAELAHVSRLNTMGELTASLAHELNQPIAAAILNANTCTRWLSREQPDMREAKEAASRVVKDTTRAAQTITRVRMLFQKSAPQQEALQVNELVREMLDLLNAEIKTNSVIVRADLAPNLPEVWSDRIQIQQVLMNLILNGIDAMKSVKGVRELRIETRRADDGGVLVQVRDSGVGIPPERMDDIFNAFYTTKSTGTGLGLRISRSIIEMHGGKLWAANNATQGANFTFTLPVNANAAQ